MLKFSTYLIIGLAFIECSATRVDTTVAQQYQVLFSEPGKCYYSIKNDDTLEGEVSASFMVKITQAVIDTVEITYSAAELEKIKDLQNRVSFRIRDAYISYEFRNERYPDIAYSRDTAYVYCAFEQEALYRYIDLDTLSTDDLVLELYKIKKEASITKIPYKKGDVMDNNTFYGEVGKWSKVRELVASSNCPLTDLPLKIQKALIRMGYDLKLSGKLDSPTKVALLDFQKINKLQEGSLDYDTLKKLNVK